MTLWATKRKNINSTPTIYQEVLLPLLAAEAKDIIWAAHPPRKDTEEHIIPASLFGPFIYFRDDNPDLKILSAAHT